MKTIYDDHYITLLIESLNGNKCQTSAGMFNSVCAHVGIDLQAKNYSHPDAHDGTNINQALLFMILKLGERVVDLEEKIKELSK